MLHIIILLAFVSCVAAKPVVLLSYEGEESNHKFLDCFNPDAEFDPSTGYITYRCRPAVKEVIEEIFDVKNMNFLNNEVDSDTLREIFEDTLIVDESSDEDDDEEQIIYEVVDIDAGKPISQNYTTENQKTAQIKNQETKKEDECKYNCCPEGQMYLSELDICVDYQSGESPRSAVSSSEEVNSESSESSPDKKPSTIYITDDSQEEQPQADSPQTKPQKNNPQSKKIASGEVLSVGKFNLKNMCQDNEFYLSELDICVPLGK